MIITLEEEGGGSTFCLMYTNVLYIFTPYLSNPSTLKGFTNHNGSITDKQEFPALPVEFQKLKISFSFMLSPECQPIWSSYTIANISILFTIK